MKYTFSDSEFPEQVETRPNNFNLSIHFMTRSKAHAIDLRRLSRH